MDRWVQADKETQERDNEADKNTIQHNFVKLQNEITKKEEEQLNDETKNHEEKEVELMILEETLMKVSELTDKRTDQNQTVNKGKLTKKQQKELKQVIFNRLQEENMCNKESSLDEKDTNVIAVRSYLKDLKQKWSNGYQFEREKMKLVERYNKMVKDRKEMQQNDKNLMNTVDMMEWDEKNMKEEKEQEDNLAKAAFM